MSLNPKEIYNKLVKEGDAWADAVHDADLLEELKSTVLAQLMAESGEPSMAAKEAWAKAHPDYKSHLENMVKARKAANRATVRWKSAQTYAELMRSQNANERAANRSAS